jgi:hypothetical protein
MAQSQSTALAKFSQTSRNATAITQALEEASQQYHLVSPATSVGHMPEGCGVALSTVLIDPEPKNGDVYPIKGTGKLGLHKTALDKIAAAAGISWDSAQSRRLDDGSHPHYCAYRAVGSYRSFDGTEVQIIGTKQLDLRDGSDQAKAAGEGLAVQRQFILEHAESKAQLRAVRSIGVRTGYSREELAKPFVVARLMWTGESADPELRRAFAMKQADAMLGGARALFGHGATPLPSGPALPAPMPPPPVGTVRDLDDAPPAERRLPQQQQQRPAPPRDAAPPASGGAVDAGDYVIEFGKNKGKKLRDLSVRQLEWYRDAFEQNIADPEKSRFVDKNSAALQQVLAEIAVRDDGGNESDNPEDY